ncbi:MAG: 3-phosphoshikimate 1-carboxyvinyltransferase, partial [Candidatus Limnocylindrales bacterium]
MAPSGSDPSDETAVVAQASRLEGAPSLPGDKSISHRALMLALLGTGESVISGASGGADV